MIIPLLITFMIGSVLCDDDLCAETYNTATDVFLSNIISKISNNITIQEVVTTVSLHLGLIGLAKLEAKGGSISGIRSLRRCKNVVVKSGGKSTLLVQTQLSAKDVKFCFNQINIGLFGKALSGWVSALTKEVIFNVDVVGNPASKCPYNIDKISVERFDDFHVDLDFGCGGCSKILKLLGNVVVKLLHNSISQFLKIKIANMLKEVVYNDKRSIVCYNAKSAFIKDMPDYGNYTL